MNLDIVAFIEGKRWSRELTIDEDRFSGISICVMNLPCYGQSLPSVVVVEGASDRDQGEENSYQRRPERRHCRESFEQTGT